MRIIARGSLTLLLWNLEGNHPLRHPGRNPGRLAGRMGRRFGLPGCNISQEISQWQLFHVVTVWRYVCLHCTQEVFSNFYTTESPTFPPPPVVLSVNAEQAHVLNSAVESAVEEVV